MNKQVPLDPFQNVVASGVAISDLAKIKGSVLEKLTLTLGGTAFTKSMITKIEIKANAKTIWESDGPKLDASNLYMGATADATVLKIDFMDRKAITPNARQAGAIDLSQGSGIETIRLEVTIAGATAPTIKGLADVSPPTSDPAEQLIRPLIARRHRATQVIGGAGTFALLIPHLEPAGGGSNYRRVFIYSSNMTGAKTVREGINEYEWSKLENEASQKDNFRVPQANLVVFDPCQDGQLSGRTFDTRRAIGVASAIFYGTFSAGETITIETEELIPYAPY